MEVAGTRGKILKAMYRLIAEKGYDKASISQVCALAGITKPSLYYYFPSKEELLLAVSESMWQNPDSQDKNFLAITDADAYRKYFEDKGFSIIANYHNDKERRRVLAELDMQATRIGSIVTQQERLARSMEDSFSTILRHGMDIGVFPANFDITGNAEFLYVVISGISQIILRQENLDAYEAWRRAISLVFHEANPR
jgi:AcrR family transcriptional regulator